MTLGVMGKKVGMTQVFDENGLAVPVTVVKLGENIVTDVKTKDKNGYEAVQVGGFAVAEKKLNKPELGNFKKRELSPLKPLKEYRIENSGAYTVGEALKVAEMLTVGMRVDVRGKSIGKGFQGTIKRYNAGRGPMSHGSKFHRSMGSIGAGTTPGRVVRGLHMPGHMGDENVCARHIKVVRVDVEKGLLLVKGSIPGVDGGLVVVTPSKSKWN
ncbi:MAG TPA: 50S ribosomal protein L3 [Candidatus Obscuribacter sp.]|nr:50S ribosomal protein L3 [Candidatus Melainabacteria bacterium]MBK8222596.1 50S ribosomal protein L3 [Candidatus Obscuribacter sp.]MBK9278796.1 50S ribosomal protein L3 [Candidatus Obscuribacter sp.]MBL8081992.1 50S ribosomal protein L3 [Candidatus Obscuribacter sp.]MDX1985529.1 50S ribosomal protein L3 [Candidatus Obscuribacter sp.]